MSEAYSIEALTVTAESDLNQIHDVLEGIASLESIKLTEASSEIMLPTVMKVIMQNENLQAEPSMEGIKELFNSVVKGIKIVIKSIERIYKQFTKWLGSFIRQSDNRIESVNSNLKQLSGGKVNELGLYNPKIKLYVPLDKVARMTVDEFDKTVDTIVDTHYLIKTVIQDISVINSDVNRYFYETAFDRVDGDTVMTLNDFMIAGKEDIQQAIYKGISSNPSYKLRYRTDANEEVTLASVNGKGVGVKLTEDNGKGAAEELKIVPLSPTQFNTLKQIDLSQWSLNPLTTLDKQFLDDIQDITAKTATQFKHSAEKMMDSLERSVSLLEISADKQAIALLRKSISVYNRTNASVHLFSLKGYQHISQSIDRYLGVYEEITLEAVKG